MEGWALGEVMLVGAAFLLSTMIISALYLLVEAALRRRNQRK